MNSSRHPHDPFDRDRDERLRFDDERDPYGSSATHAPGYDAGMKRPRSPSPPYGRYHSSTAYEHEDPYRTAGGGSGWDAKRARSRDEYERDWGNDYAAAAPSGPDGGYSPQPQDRSRRTWDELDPEEKEREWQRYEREREYDRYYADAGDDGRYRAGGPRSGYDRPPHLSRHDDGQHPAPYAFSGGRPDHYPGGSGAEELAGAAGRAAGPRARLVDPMDSPTILTFKRYTQLLRELGKEPAALASGAEATQALYEKYQDYRKAFHRRAMEQYWKAHKDERWFQEKYGVDADVVQARLARRRKGRQGRKAAWLNELQTGVLDKVCWDAEADQSAGSSVLTTTNRLGEREVVEDTDSLNLPSESNQLLVRFVPPEISRSALEEAVEDEPGFSHLAMGEPHPLKRYGRVGCVVFEQSAVDELDQAAARLCQKLIAGQKLAFERTSRPAQAKLRVAPEYASTLSRMLHDLRQARQLVAMLEYEDVDVLWKNEEADEALKVKAGEEIEQRAFNIVLATADTATEQASLRAWLADALAGESSETTDKATANDEAHEASNDTTPSSTSTQKRDLVRKMLDLHIDLLRQVYNCEYYTSTLSDFPEELLRRAPKSLRRVNNTSLTAKESTLAEKDKLWASNVDLKHELLMRPDDNAIGALGGTDLQAMLLDLAAPYSREDEVEKHRCIVKVNDEECGKPFKAQIFVQKHVLNKHREWFHTLMADKIADAKYFNNYVRDPQRPMPPLQQQHQPDRNGKDGVAATLPNGGGHHHTSSLTARLGGYDYNGGHNHSNGGGAGGLPSSSYYGPGNLVRLGGTAPAWSMGRGASDLRDRIEDGGGGVIRMGASTAAQPHRRPVPGSGGALDALEPLPAPPKPLDPRASMAPAKSYHDLDAGVPSGGAELDLEY